MEKAKKKDEGTIFIGQKPTMAYVNAIVTRLERKDKKEIKVIGIGISNIGVAVDAVEKAIRFLAAEKVVVEKDGITTGPKVFEDGGNVSMIEIVLKKSE